MQIWLLISRVLSILMTVSLLTTSMVILLSVAPMDDASTADMSDMTSMADEIPRA